MKALNFILFFMCLCALFVFPASSQSQNRKTFTGSQREIAQINSYSKTVDKLTSRIKEPMEVYANTSTTQKPKWSKFKTKKFMKKLQRTVKFTNPLTELR